MAERGLVREEPVAGLSDAPAAAPGRRLPGWLRRSLSFVGILVLLVAAWEGYKVAGKALDISWPIRPDNTSMPHVWDIVAVLFRPARRGGEDILLVILIEAAWFTWKEALAGFLLGSLIGFGLAVAFVRWRILDRGLMPYVIASQTVPLLAIAPMVVIWGARLGWPQWRAVAIIAAYLTFFPVTINTLRGLRSPAATSLELMRSYAAKPREVLWKVQIPAALPYLFTALKVAATASVIGAIIGELPAGLGEGLGRVLLNFMYTFITFPEKLYAAILVSGALGIVFVGVVTLAERLVIPANRRLES